MARFACGGNTPAVSWPIGRPPRGHRQWAIGMDRSGPLTIEALRVVFPTPLRNGYAVRDDCYSTPTEFMIKCTFANGVELFIRHDTDNGILFEARRAALRQP